MKRYLVCPAEGIDPNSPPTEWPSPDMENATEIWAENHNAAALGYMRGKPWPASHVLASFWVRPAAPRDDKRCFFWLVTLHIRALDPEDGGSS